MVLVQRQKYQIPDNTPVLTEYYRVLSGLLCRITRYSLVFAGICKYYKVSLKEKKTLTLPLFRTSQYLSLPPTSFIFPFLDITPLAMPPSIQGPRPRLPSSFNTVPLFLMTTVVPVLP